MLESRVVLKSRKPSITTTIRQMKIDDIAIQMAMRFNFDPAKLKEDNYHTRTVRNLAQIVVAEKRYPETVGEWVSIVMLHGSDPKVKIMREHAGRAGQASYVKAERWLALIDKVKAA